MTTLEGRHDLITVLKPHCLPKRLRPTKSYVIKAMDHAFYGFTGVIPTRDVGKTREKLSVNHEPKAKLMFPTREVQ